MSAEDIRTSSDSEDEAIQDAIDDDDDVRYSLRSRSVSKAQDASVKTSTGLSGVIVEETRVSANTGVRTTDARPPTSRASMRSDTAREDHNMDVEDGQEEGRTRDPLVHARSPFEMVPTRGWMSAGPRQAPPRCTAISGYTDAGARSRMQDRSRIALPFQFNREDIPYVPSHTRMTEMPTLTSAFTTRMTTREQARVELEENLDAKTDGGAAAYMDGIPSTTYSAAG